MAGEEYIRALSFSNDPHKHGDYYDASPCKAADLSQNRLEPILLRYATQSGLFKIRYDTKMVSFTQNDESGLVETVLEDHVTGGNIVVQSKYLCGADGGKSKVAEILQLPFVDKGSGGLALNVRVEADLV